MVSFDKSIAQAAIAGLRERGVVVAKGLSDLQVGRVEEALGAKLPNDLRLLLSEGVPIEMQGGVEFPNWHKDPANIVRHGWKGIEAAFIFDIENNDYWHTIFGLRPSKLVAAKQQALKVLKTLPPLIPVYGHRYMPSQSARGGSPVLSIYQASDTVYFGYSLSDYFFKEFGVKLSLEVPTDPETIPYWDALFFGNMNVADSPFEQD